MISQSKPNEVAAWRLPIFQQDYVVFIIFHSYVLLHSHHPLLIYTPDRNHWFVVIVVHPEYALTEEEDPMDTGDNMGEEKTDGGEGVSADGENEIEVDKEEEGDEEEGDDDEESNESKT